MRSAWRDAGVCAPGQRGIGQAGLEASWHSGSALQTKVSFAYLGLITMLINYVIDIDLSIVQCVYIG